MSTPGRDVSGAVAITVVAVFANEVIHAGLGIRVHASTLLVPVAVIAYRGGLRLGLIATLTSVIGLALFGGPSLEPLLMLAVNGAIVSALSQRLIVDRREALSSQARFEAVFEANPMPLIVLSTKTSRYRWANAAFLELTGWTHDELVGRDADDVRLFVDEADRRRAYAEFARDGVLRDRVLEIQTRTGEPRTVSASAVGIELDGVRHLVVSYSDITARVRTEAALRESEARFRQVTEAIREVFWLTDITKQQMLYISPAYEAIWGRTCAELMARPTSWLDAIHVDDRARVEDAVRTRQATGTYDEEYRIVRADGTTRTIRDRAFVIRDAAGTVIRIAGIAEDLTERVALEEQLRQTQKLESLGMLAGGVAHDFNNVLAVIASCTEVLAECPGSDRELIEEIDHAVSRATGLTRQLLAFSRREAVAPVVLDVNACVDETRKMLRRMVGEDIELTTSLEPDLPAVRIDPGYLVQVIMNLAVNARDAMPRGGSLSLTTRTVTVDAFAGPAVLIAVRDTGCGMSAEIQARIFDPFFTTKSVGRGTGLGLAVVRGIVEQARGFIRVTSAPGEGTTFEIYLPGAARALIADARPIEIAPRGSETVVLVDDDAHVRRAASASLRARGFTVLDAPSGASALALLDAHPETALLVTDVVMPEMDGRDLAEHVRARRPELPVLFMSGYTDETLARRSGEQPRDLLEKPFRLEALATRIRRVLDRQLRTRAA